MPVPNHITTTSPEHDRQGSFFSMKKILLTLVSIAFIASLSQLNRYHEWQLKLEEYWQAFEEQKNELSVEERMNFYNNGYAYRDCMEIKRHIDAAGAADALILFPPESYFKKEHIDFIPPEPAVFYYLTGLSSTHFNSAIARNANFFVHINNQEIRTVRIKSPAQLAQIIAYYQKYEMQ